MNFFTKLKKAFNRLSSSAILVLGFGALILTGAILLNLPISSQSGIPIGFINALFTSTSGVCITGLSVFDPGTALTLFGQIVLLVLIQLGGLGFMTMTSIIVSALGRRLSLHERILLSDSFNADRLKGIAKLTQRVVTITAVVEGAGILLLAVRFVPMFGISRGWYYSVFQSISAFCNAGFDVFGYGDNMVAFVYDPLINIVTMILIVTGGLGFVVIIEILKKIRTKNVCKKRLSLHTKIVLCSTALLIIGGFMVFLFAEGNNPKTLGAAGTPISEKILGAFFQSVTTRTAGFQTIPQGDMLPISRFASIGLMFIGGSPAGTAGGIKTTTFAAVILFVVSIIKGKDEVEIDCHRLNQNAVKRAIAIFSLGIGAVLLGTAIVSSIEYPRASLSAVAYEVMSAFGTVGLSTGITPFLASSSKIILIVLMYMGRVGIFTFATALINRIGQKKGNLHYPDGKIIIG